MKGFDILFKTWLSCRPNGFLLHKGGSPGCLDESQDKAEQTGHPTILEWSIKEPKSGPSQIFSRCAKNNPGATHHSPALHGLQVRAETEPGPKDDRTNEVDVAHEFHRGRDGLHLTPVQIEPKRHSLHGHNHLGSWRETEKERGAHVELPQDAVLTTGLEDQMHGEAYSRNSSHDSTMEPLVFNSRLF